MKRMCTSMTNPSALLERKNDPRWWKCRPIIARVEMKHMIERAMPHALLELEKLSSFCFIYFWFWLVVVVIWLHICVVALYCSRFWYSR